MKSLHIIVLILLSISMYIGSASISMAAILAPSGATGVSVDGIIYDVTFVDIACEELWAPCGAGGTGAIPFTFTTSSEALLASAALRDLFALNGLSAISNYADGCTSNTDCSIFTPYSLSSGFNSVSSSYRVFNGVPSIGSGHLTAKTDSLLDNTNIVYADWRVSTVPVPAAIWLFGSGLLGLLGVARRKARMKPGLLAVRT